MSAAAPPHCRESVTSRRIMAAPACCNKIIVRDRSYLGRTEWTVNPRMWYSRKMTIATTIMMLHVTIQVFQFVRLRTLDAGMAGIVACKRCRLAFSGTDDLTANDVFTLNASHRVARIHYQGCVLPDPAVVIVRMVCDDQHTIRFFDVLYRCAFHLQIVMASLADDRKIGIVVADLSAIRLQQLNYGQGRRLAQIVDVLLVRNTKYQHFGTFQSLPLLIQSSRD